MGKFITGPGKKRTSSIDKHGTWTWLAMELEVVTDRINTTRRWNVNESKLKENE